MFAVGHQTGTHTRIVIAGRRREDRRTDPATRKNSTGHRVARPKASAKAEAPAQGAVH